MSERRLQSLEGRRNEAMNTLYMKARFFVKELAAQIGVDPRTLQGYDNEGYLLGTSDEDDNRPNFLEGLTLPQLEQMAQMAGSRVKEGHAKLHGKDSSEAEELHRLRLEVYRRYSPEELLAELFRRYPGLETIPMTPDGRVEDDRSGQLIHISEKLSLQHLKELLGEN